VGEGLMALLTFPLSLSQFANGLQIENIDMHIVHGITPSGLGTGNMIIANRRSDYWVADVKIRPLYHKAARALQAMINSMDGGLNDFLLCDPVCAYPAEDPDGTILGTSTITNSSVNANGIQMNLTGFPVGYVLSTGDRFSFTYGPGNIYRALHEIVVGDTANGSGTVGIEFRPRLDDPDLATGKTMDLKRACARMKIIEESIEHGSRQDLFTSGLSFSCEQVP
jgi:hypothetical protein